VAGAAVPPVAVETAPAEEARRQPVKEEAVLPPAAVSKEKVAAENQKKRAVADQVMLMMTGAGSKKSRESAAKRMTVSMARGERARHRQQQEQLGEVSSFCGFRMEEGSELFNCMISIDIN
jgi:hypothetical protein